MMDGLSIARKIWLAFAAIIFVALLQIAISFWVTVNVERAGDNVLYHTRLASELKTLTVTFGEARHKLGTILIAGSVQDIAAVESATDQLVDRAQSFVELAERVPDVAAIGVALADDIRVWQRELVANQLADMEDPYTFDLARVRAVAPESLALFQRIDDRLREAKLTLTAMLDADVTRQTGLVFAMKLAAILAGALMIVLCLLAGTFVSLKVARPILRLADVTQRLNRREWTVEVPAMDRGDEIGTLAVALDRFRTAGQEAETLAARRNAEVQAKKAEAERLSAAIDDFRGRVGEAIATFASADNTLDRTAGTLQTVASDSETIATDVREAADVTGQSIQSVAAAVEETTMSVSDISAQLDRVREISGTTLSATEAAAKTVRGLRDRSETIEGVVSLIHDIASQINMLALNATIESARAGEAGKGFAVVAAQVKQLADQTAKATETVGKVIGEVTSEVATVVDAISNIEDDAREVKTNASTVAAALAQQRTAISEISQNVSTVAQRTSEVANGMKIVGERVADTRAVAVEVGSLSRTLADCRGALEQTVNAFVAAVSRPGSPANDANPHPLRRAA